jgi:hypothetical protein
MKKVIQGYMSRYSDCWLFETDKTSYSSEVASVIDELLGFITRDGDEIKITIEHLGNVHDEFNAIYYEKIEDDKKE